TADLLDINTSHGFPISDQQDLNPESEIVVPDPSDSASKFERFAVATILRSSPATSSGARGGQAGPWPTPKNRKLL
ncbi:hypothetical protein A2U01_0057354, partial [Trifolium medium]|nr:hypothetical protein [Trifolium medium]